MISDHARTRKPNTHLITYKIIIMIVIILQRNYKLRVIVIFNNDHNDIYDFKDNDHYIQKQEIYSINLLLKSRMANMVEL